MDDQAKTKQQLMDELKELRQKVSELEVVEQALRESERKFRLVTETIQDVFWMSTPGVRQMVYISPGYEKVWGRTTESLHKSPWSFLEVVHPDDREQLMSIVQGHHSKGKEYACEYRIIPTDHSVRWIHERGFPVHDNQGKLTLMCGVCTDITERKLMEEALRSRERLLDKIYDILPVGLWIADKNGHLLRSNDAGKKIWGAEPLVGQEEYGVFRARRLPSGEEIAPADWALARTVNEGITVSDELLEIDPFDGEKRIILNYTAPVLDESGKVDAAIIVNLDVTQRIRAEEALRESEEQYRAVFDNAGVGIDLLDRDGRMVKVNKALLNMLGYAEEELRQLTFLDITHPSDREISKRNLEALMEGEIDSYRLEKRYVRKDGNIVWVDLWSSTIRDANGGHAGTVAIIEDITERKQAEEALSKQAEFMTNLMEAIPVPVFFKDVDQVYVGCNNAFAQFVGLPAERILGKPVFDVVSQETAEIFREYDEKLFRKPGTQVYSTSVKRFDGSTREVIFHKATYGDPDGPVLGLIGVILDITDRKILEQQLLQAQKMEAIGTLAGGIAHDFNNLLQVTLGFSDLLLAEKREDDPEYADLMKIFQAARSGTDLVRRLLMFSRKAEPKPVPMNLNKQIVEVEKLLRRTIPRMIKVRLDLYSDLPRINADPSQVEQVIMNLAVNARDAMPDKGKLILRTDIVTLDEEYCKLHVEANPGEHVLLEVSDTGHGMDEQTTRHIFEPFFTTKDVGRGTGLGLAMVHGIVKQHNGHITIYSEVGKGTIFRIYLPAIQGEVETDVETTGIMPAIGTETVLLVDDEEFVRELGARILTKHGYTVLQAINGREGLDLFKKERSGISLVILDLIMPEMGGTECLRELLKIDPQVNVLVASGYSADASVRETIQMGAKGVVTKPFRVKELLRDVRRVLDDG